MDPLSTAQIVIPDEMDGGAIAMLVLGIILILILVIGGIGHCTQGFTNMPNVPNVPNTPDYSSPCLLYGGDKTWNGLGNPISDSGNPIPSCLFGKDKKENLTITSGMGGLAYS